MEPIYRRRVIDEEIEIPEGNKICTWCKGRGMISKYDEGWRSVVHSEELAALKECFVCNALGYVRADG